MDQTLSPETQAVVESLATGKPVDPEIAKRIHEKARKIKERVFREQGLVVDEGTLYPLLRRLETQGLLASQWREEGKRNKRFYKLSEDGRRMLTQLLAEWRSIDTSLNNILSESSHGFARQVSAGS